MRWLDRLLFSDDPAIFKPVASQTPFYAIGDIHGCLDELRQLLEMLDPSLLRVYVGDYIDRGDDSAGVLRAVMNDTDAISLLGNHEDMMLQFIDDPVGKARRWLDHGGLDTMESFDVKDVASITTQSKIIAARDALVDAMGDELLAWLQKRPSYYVNGNVAVVHAGANPAKPIDAQRSTTHIWGHRDFATQSRHDGMWVLHGHTIVDAPSAFDGRIPIDTGAYATGRLTAAHVTPTGVTFQTTRGGQ